jgi:hypothetical protein
LTGTPIKKNYPQAKRRKLCFYPRKFPICGPYVIIWCGWHLVGTISTDSADELAPTARIRNRKIVGTCRFFWCTRIREGYILRRKSRYCKLNSNIKIRDISYTPLSSVCYYIYKETDYFTADYNIKNNIRKFIIKLREKKEYHKIIIQNKFASKGKRKNKSSRKARGFVSTDYSNSSTDKSLFYIDFSDNIKPEIITITKEQKNKTSRKHPSSWLIDNSASSHIIHKLNLFRGLLKKPLRQ